MAEHDEVERDEAQPAGAFHEQIGEKKGAEEPAEGFRERLGEDDVAGEGESDHPAMLHPDAEAMSDEIL